MSVFMLNVCKFNDCGLRFKNLHRLIEHIEDVHIDFDPRVIEQTEQQQPTCIPLSYVLRYHALKKENINTAQQPSTNNSLYSSNVTTTSPGSEIEEADNCVSEMEDSSDSWTMCEEFPNDIVSRYGSRTSNQNTSINQSNATEKDKPFACPVPGCKKRYKNVNGKRYHMKNGHKNDGKTRKAFKCSCGKNYKTSYGLKNHTMTQHNNGHLKTIYPKPNLKTERSDIDFDEMPRMQSKQCRPKVPAIEDHGYIKTEHVDIDCDLALGILTPAASPIKVDATSQSQAYKYLSMHSVQRN